MLFEVEKCDKYPVYAICQKIFSSLVYVLTKNQHIQECHLTIMNNDRSARAWCQRQTDRVRTRYRENQGMSLNYFSLFYIRVYWWPMNKTKKLLVLLTVYYYISYYRTPICNNNVTCIHHPAKLVCMIKAHTTINSNCLRNTELINK